MRHLLLFAALIVLVVAPDDSSSEDDDGTRTVASKAKKLAGLTVVVVTVKTCLLCGNNSGMAHPYQDKGFWPWVNYKKLDDISKQASGTLCTICRAVYKLSTLRKEHGSIKKYMKWKNSQDPASRHAYFMKCFRRFIELGNACPGEGKERFASQADMGALKVVSSNQTDGLKHKVPMQFVEVWKWKETNPHKKVPLDRVVKREIKDDDGSKKTVEGIWQWKRASGVHDFELYEDLNINTNTVLDKGDCIIADNQQEIVHELSAKQLGISKVLSLDDICALDDASDEAGDAAADEDKHKSDDSDDSNFELSDEDVPVFNKGVIGAIAKKKAAPTSGAKAMYEHIHTVLIGSDAVPQSVLGTSS